MWQDFNYLRLNQTNKQKRLLNRALSFLSPCSSRPFLNPLQSTFHPHQSVKRLVEKLPATSTLQSQWSKSAFILLNLSGGWDEKINFTFSKDMLMDNFVLNCIQGVHKLSSCNFKIIVPMRKKCISHSRQPIYKYKEQTSSKGEGKYFHC